MGLLMRKPVKKAAKKPAKKMVMEKRTGEKYASKSAMRKHEKSEGKMERVREYGKGGKR
jgi:hypothetical protein